MFGRPELCFWRVFGFLAITVSLINIMVLLNGNYKLKPLPQELMYHPQALMPLVNFSGSPLIVDRKSPDESTKLRADLSKIAVKNPLWLSVVDLQKYFDSGKVLAVGRKREKSGYLVIGVPTVYRKKAYYLVDTVKWLVNNLPLKDRLEVVIVVFVADFDENYRKKVVSDMKESFPSAVNDGLIQVIYAPREYYPNLNNLPLLYGDKPNRVQWRSKQSLDYSFMYYYCANLGQYYIQLEDDVLTEAGYFSKVKTYLESKTDKEWSTIEFGARGFIGMTYRTKNLPSLAKFTRFYFWTMPIDWLFRVYNDIFLFGNSKKDVVKPPIFKHIGEYSSLDGQFRKLEDLKKPGKKDIIKHIYQSAQGNPPATINTSVKDHVAGHTIENAYSKEGYFWGKSISEGQYIEVIFDTPAVFSRIVIPSGSPLYPSDSLLDSALSISTEPYMGKCTNLREVARFVNAPVIDHKFKETNKIYCIRFTFEKVRLDQGGNKRWLIIREIALMYY